MLDFQTWIERNLGKWTYRETLVSLLLITLIITGFETTRVVMAAPVRLDSGATLPVAFKRWLSRDDSRSFASTAALSIPGGEDGRFDVAWISGSPISIRKAPTEWRLDGKSGYEMTDVLARYLLSMDGKPVRIQEFLLQGVRTGDMRRAVLFAAYQPEIDAYIVEANSVWMLNDFLQFTLSRQRASMLHQDGKTWLDYSVAARILRAHEIGFELLSVVPLIRDRYDFFGNLPISKASPFPFRKAEPVVRDGEMIATWQRLFFPGVLALPASPTASLTSYRNIMLMNNLDPDGLGMEVFTANVRTLAETGKPVLIFMPPVNPKLKDDPAAVAYVQSMTEALDEAFAKSGTPNVSFHSETIWAEPQPFEFLDILHLSHGQGVIDLVVAMLEERIGKPFAKRSIGDVYGKAVTAPTKETDQ